MNKNEKKLLKYMQESIAFNGNFKEIEDKIQIKPYKKKKNYFYISLTVSLALSLSIILCVPILLKGFTSNNVSDNSIANGQESTLENNTEVSENDSIQLNYKGYIYEQIEILSKDSLKIKDYIENYQGYEIYQSDNDDEIIIKINEIYILLKKISS